MAIVTASLVLGMSSNAIAATAVNLGSAASYGVLGGSTVTNTGSTVINGDLGLNPGTSLTGFPPGTVNGTTHQTDGASATAQSDLTAAYNSASSQTGAVSIAGDLGGQTLAPGVYNSASSIGLTGTLTLDGQNNANSVFVFQAGSTLTTASASKINLINGAQACNVYWQVGSSATLGTNSTFVGSVMALTSITATTGGSGNGRLLARNGAVTLDTNSVSRPVCATAVVVAPTPAPVVAPVVVAPTPLLATPTPSLAMPVTVPSLPKTDFNPVK
ncbi:MAG: hypothetical protein NVSMB66_3880 [Candidatus Doudnabacteria bacterium]